MHYFYTNAIIMRHLVIILLVFISFRSLGQVSVSEMMNLYKMDASEFETYALKNKYLYNGIIDKKGKVKETEYIVKGIEYSKVNNQEEYSDVCLSYLNTFDNKGKAILYQTKKLNDYINFKSQLKIYGLKLIKSEIDFGDDGMINTFRNKDYEIMIHINPKTYYGSSDAGYWAPVSYDIILSKINK